MVSGADTDEAVWESPHFLMSQGWLPTACSSTRGFGLGWRGGWTGAAGAHPAFLYSVATCRCSNDRPQRDVPVFDPLELTNVKRGLYVKRDLAGQIKQRVTRWDHLNDP